MKFFSSLCIVCSFLLTVSYANAVVVTREVEVPVSTTGIVNADGWITCGDGEPGGGQVAKGNGCVETVKEKLIKITSEAGCSAWEIIGACNRIKRDYVLKNGDSVDSILDEVGNSLAAKRVR